jgi:hypothetical protein
MMHGLADFTFKNMAIHKNEILLKGYIMRDEERMYVSYVLKKGPSRNLCAIILCYRCD